MDSAAARMGASREEEDAAPGPAAGASAAMRVGAGAPSSTAPPAAEELSSGRERKPGQSRPAGQGAHMAPRP